MKAVGTNTAERTSAMPTTGPESSSIAFNAASFGVIPSSIWRSTPSTPTMASSTTSPIAITKQREEYERAYQGNRYGQQWNQRGAPTLKKKKNNNDDQDQRDHKGFNDFLDALSHRKRRIERNGEVNVLGESLFRLRHQLLDPGCRIDRVRSGQLIRGNDGARLAVKASRDAVILRTKLHSSDVAHSYGCTVGCFADNNVAEFFR